MHVEAKLPKFPRLSLQDEHLFPYQFFLPHVAWEKRDGADGDRSHAFGNYVRMHVCM
jgi:hypothetical protein